MARAFCSRAAIVGVATALLLVGAGRSQATDAPPVQLTITSWDHAKRLATGIYADREITVYCGCAYTPDGTSGEIKHASCGYEVPSVNSHRAGRMEWEHVTPASTVRGDHPAWQEGGRRGCERDPHCGAALFDLHNLAPSVGQVNAIRSNKPFRELDETDHAFGDCPIKSTRDAFEPPACLRGDVARVYLYMELEHGLKLPDAKRRQYQRWSAADPVSPWEFEREQRIAQLTGASNPFIADQRPDSNGACPWEPLGDRADGAMVRSL